MSTRSEAAARAYEADGLVIVGWVPVPDEHGCLPVPEGPGLGAKLTDSFLERPGLIRNRTADSVAESQYRSDPWLTMKF